MLWKLPNYIQVYTMFVILCIYACTISNNFILYICLNLLFNQFIRHSDNENLPNGNYDRNACLRESEVFETTNNLRNTWRYYDTQGIPFTLKVESDCGSGRGIDDSDSAGYTLYRIYEVDDSGSTTEFECIHAIKTECKEESDGVLEDEFPRLDGDKRYLFVATGSIELVTVCDVSDDCTTDFGQ